MNDLVNKTHALEMALFYLMTLPSIIAEEGAMERSGMQDPIIDFIEKAHAYTHYNPPERQRLKDMLNGRKMPTTEE